MVRVVPVSGSEDLARFCAVGGHTLNPQAVTLHKPDASLLVEDGSGVPQGRCSLWWRRTAPHPGQELGYVGHYAVADPAAAPVLLAEACARLAAEGRTLAVGPIDGNTWQRYRLVTERGSEPPFFLEPDNPDDWPGQFTAAGFQPLASYSSSLSDDLTVGGPRLGPCAARVAERGIRLRPFRPEDFEAELRRVYALSVVAFQENFLYTPLDEAEFLGMYTPLRPYLRPDLVQLAERDGELVGFLFAVPDLAQVRRGRAVPDTVILKTFAVHPSTQGIGLGSLLLLSAHEAARAAGFTRVILALFHENSRTALISRHVARIIRRYTLFARAVGGQP